MVQPGTETPLSPSNANTSHCVSGSSSDQRSPPSKRARGRPIGSKNKPKLPIVIHQDNHHLQKPIFIQVPKASDVIQALVKFARDYQINIAVQSASGSIFSATLCTSQSSTSSTFIVHGPFTLVSLTGTCINNNLHVASSSSSSSSPSYNLDLCCSFRLSISSDSGQSFMGVVGGKVIAGDDVNVTATIFKDSVNYDADTNEANVEKDNNNLNT